MGRADVATAQSARTDSAATASSASSPESHPTCALSPQLHATAMPAPPPDQRNITYNCVWDDLILHWWNLLLLL